MKKTEYDFIAWFPETSPPSCAKLINDEGQGWTNWPVADLSVKPGAAITLEFKAKQENVMYTPSAVVVNGWDGKEWIRIWGVDLPLGSFDWRTVKPEKWWIPPGVSVIRVFLSGGAGDRERPGITWFDDLKIYMDDRLIYENKFSNWLPYQIAGAVITAIPVGLYAARRMPKITVPQEWWK